MRSCRPAFMIVLSLAAAGCSKDPGIATREACEAAGGRFHERIFGWMVHANLVREADGTRRIVWHEEHAH